MTVLGAISALPSMPGVDAARGATATSASNGAGAAAGGDGSFMNVLGDALSRLNTQLTSADASMAAFSSGQSADIGTVMLQMQEASLGLKMGVQVRDRLLDAYNTVMRLQL
jgi:flagellar hook-basal body complex protein FliE